MPFNTLLWYRNTIGIDDAEIAKVLNTNLRYIWAWRVKGIHPRDMDTAYWALYRCVQRRLRWIEKEKNKWSWY